MLLQDDRSAVNAEISRLATGLSASKLILIAGKAARVLLRDHPSCGMTEEEIVDAIVKVALPQLREPEDGLSTSDGSLYSAG